jgi:hypothetical protein
LFRPSLGRYGSDDGDTIDPALHNAILKLVCLSERVDDPEADQHKQRKPCDNASSTHGFFVGSASWVGAPTQKQLCDEPADFVLLADYNPPNGLSGLDLALGLREAVGREVPAIILTGNISAGPRP